MAYDRFVAICHPLHYTTIMSQNLCVLLLIVSCILDNTIPHYFCDLSALLKLSSSDTTINKLVILPLGTLVITLPFICILVSYSHIGATILRTPSIKGIYKALSTAIIGLYLVPSSDNTNDKDVIVAVMYTVVTLMLNPFIYSLRNRDMKEAMSNILSRRVCSQGWV
ncbi:Olfactory receptor 50 [Lemmus lemmus]